MKSEDDNQELHSNNKENPLELGDILPQEILEDQKVTRGKNCIKLAIIAFCKLCYTQNQCSNILQITASCFVYADNITKYMVENLYCMGFLIIYKTIR